MKKFFVLLAIVTLLLPSCQKINDRIDGLEDRIDQVEGTQIATINQQIEAINTTLPQLRETDTELKEYIKSLQTTATNLQEQITNTNDDIDELEDALDQAIADAEASNDALKTELVAQLNTAKADILAQLEATKTALEAELNQVNSTIATLQAKDAELEGKITTLEEYVNTELQNTEDWATATFATLEQYNTIVEDIATIKTQIEALNTSLTNLEERLNTKIATDIATAVEGLQGELATKVTEITTAYTDAISTAKEEIAVAYTEAIAATITNLESSMKEWVNEQLTGYYTIAETEAAIERLKGHITSGDAAFQEIEMLSQRMEDVKTEITEAYQKAIETAITENNGIIDSKIASEVATINGRIDQEVATINAKIAEIESRLDNIEARITELLARIQSVTYVPQYSDGKATMDYNTKSAEFDFIISSKDAVPALASVWKDALSVKAIYTQTRAVEFIDLPITSFEADTINGVISLTVSGENLKDAFYLEQQDASAFLQISDGNSNISSEYVAMTPNYNIKFEDLQVKAICCKNWDTNRDGELSYEEAAAVTSNLNFSENDYIVSFPEFKYFTNVSGASFSDCSNLSKIELPEHLTAIEHTMFVNCSSLTSIDIPENVTKFGFKALCGTNIKSIVLPKGVTSIDEQALSVQGDLDIYCKAETPPSVYYYIYSNTNSQTGFISLNSSKIINIYVPTEYYDSYLEYRNKGLANGEIHILNWSKYISYLRPYDFNE